MFFGEGGSKTQNALKKIFSCDNLEYWAKEMPFWALKNLLGRKIIKAKDFFMVGVYHKHSPYLPPGHLHMCFENIFQA
jgi:hypothetical protein